MTLLSAMEWETRFMMEDSRVRVHLSSMSPIDDDSTELEEEPVEVISDDEPVVVLPRGGVRDEAKLEEYRVSKGLPDNQKLLYSSRDNRYGGSDVLLLEVRGPYGKELFVLEEGTFTMESVPTILNLFTVDERGHLLRCLEDGGDIIEPQSADDCPICLDPCYDRYRLKRNLPCGHQVCLKCLPTLPTCGGKCPLCRLALR